MNSILNTVSTLVVVTLLLVSSSTTDATNFMYQNDLVCNDPVTLSVESAGCVGADYCTFGDKVSAYGTLTLSEVLPSSTMCMKTKACLNSNSWLCTSHTYKVDVCSDFELEGTSGEECPEAGEYKFDVSKELPNLGSFSFGNGYYVTTYFTFTDCSDESEIEIKCAASFKTVSSSSSSSSSSAYIAGAALLGLSSLAAVMFVRKRRLATINLNHEESLVQQDHTSSGNFEMMNNSVRV